MLNHETLGKLNHGCFAEEIDAAIAQAMADAVTRSSDRARKVTITLEITPDQESSGEVMIAGACQVTLPKSKTDPTAAELRMVGKTWCAMLPGFEEEPAERELAEVA